MSNIKIPVNLGNTGSAVSVARFYKVSDNAATQQDTPTNVEYVPYGIAIPGYYVLPYANKTQGNWCNTTMVQQQQPQVQQLPSPVNAVGLQNGYGGSAMMPTTAAQAQMPTVAPVQWGQQLPTQVYKAVQQNGYGGSAMVPTVAAQPQFQTTAPVQWGQQNSTQVYAAGVPNGSEAGYYMLPNQNATNYSAPMGNMQTAWGGGYTSS